ncbi:Antitoxin MazE [Leclercia adecarboxylata]|uniref:Antitoxin MazE n=1 Tax=Leclercia adecarboxylata TaxID=83655 RepID=A0A4U9HUU3_9ENTR|nr:Antitoxin MazE [Leclercia adecarboxylata]
MLTHKIPTLYDDDTLYRHLESFLCRKSPSKNGVTALLSGCLSQLCARAELHVDDVVNVNVDEEGRIILTPVRKDEPTLESLLAAITDDNLHHEVTFGEPQSKELL